jgi:hypothetical protein
MLMADGWKTTKSCWLTLNMSQLADGHAPLASGFRMPSDAARCRDIAVAAPQSFGTVLANAPVGARSETRRSQGERSRVEGGTLAQKTRIIL